MNKLKLKQIEEEPGSNLYRNISWTIIGSAIVTFIYYIPFDISNATIGEIVEGTNQSGTIYLTTLIEPSQSPKRFEVSGSIAKLLKSQQAKSKTCYVKARVINGMIPLITDWKIISFEFNSCR